MNVTLEQEATHWLLRLDGQLTLASAAELKAVLLQWVTDGQKAGKPLELDLESAEEIDITIMQLISAAAREASRTGARIAMRASEAVIRSIREAGFDQAAGFPIQE